MGRSSRAGGRRKGGGIRSSGLPGRTLPVTKSLCQAWESGGLTDNIRATKHIDTGDC